MPEFLTNKTWSLPFIMSTLKKTTLLQLLLVITFLPCLKADTVQLDSLSTVLNKAIEENNQESQIDLYFQLGEAIYKKREYSRAADFFVKMSLLAELRNDRKNLGKALYYLGKSYRRAENHNLAIAKLEELISMSANVNSEYLDKAHFEASKAYQAVSDYENGYRHQISSLQLREEKNDTAGQMRCLYQLGNIFFYQDNFQLALDYYQKTKSVAETIHDKKYTYNSLAAIGSVFQQEKDIDKSVHYSKLAMKLAKAMKYKLGLAYTYANIGENFYILQQYDSAMYYIEKSLNLTDKVRDNGVKSTALRLSGKTHLKLNNPEKALELLDSALNLAKTYEYNSRILEIYMELANTHKALKNPLECDSYLRSYIELKDSLVNENVLAEMGKVQTKYEVLKKEKEIAQKDSEYEKMYRNFLTGGIILLLGLLWLIYSNYKKQRETNALLETKNTEIELQNQQLEKSNAELQQFAFIASHDLKEPLRNIGSYASLIQRRYGKEMGEECTEFFGFIQDGISKMYRLLNDVLDFSKLDYADNQTELIDTQEIVNKVTLNLNQQIKAKNADILISELPKVMVNQTHLSQLFQNLLSNGLKFTNGKKPEIKVSCQSNGTNSHVFSVKDNGIGFDMAYKDKIFEMFQRLDKKNEEEGTGVGLAICKKIVQQYGGDIWVESAENEGTTFFFSLPTAN